MKQVETLVIRRKTFSLKDQHLANLVQILTSTIPTTARQEAEISAIMLADVEQLRERLSLRKLCYLDARVAKEL